MKLPLKNARITQPFGVDYIGGGFYAKLGMKGHNGIDFSAVIGTPVYAVIDGQVYCDDEKQFGKGYGNVIRQRSEYYGLECVYGHLSEFKVQSGSLVNAGDLIALSGNTGLSTGPHLHFGARKMHYNNGAGPFYDDYDNGYFGYFDPLPLFDQNDLLMPVEKKYGMKESDRGYSDWEWYKVAAWFYATFRRLPTTMEKYAFVWGRWSAREVLDPCMWQTWTQMTKMQFNHLSKKV